MESNIKRESDVELGPVADPRKRRRWGDAEDRVTLPHDTNPFFVPPGLHPDHENLYLFNLRFNDLRRRMLDTDWVGLDGVDLSPPEIVTDRAGKQLNMKEMRVREGLEEEKRRLAEWAHKLIPNFVSPGDYAPKLSKITHKIFIPTDKPSSTYMGFIIGPRGRTQKKLEQETRCKIVIRGKGATKAGSVQYHSDDDEPIHVLIEGDKELDVINAAKVVEALLGDFHPVFEEYKKEQLRIVAELNGITREGAGFFPLNEKNLLELYDMDPKDLHREISQPACFICKEKGHAPANCPKRNAPKDKPSKDKALEDFMKEIAKPIVAPAPAEPIPVPLNPSGKVGELYQYMYQLGSMK